MTNQACERLQDETEAQRVVALICGWLPIMNEPIIRLIGVKKSFDSQVVLDGVDIDIVSNRTTVIAGGSGQGKSVTLKLILGLLKPDSGQILIDGRDVTGMKGRELKEIRSQFGVLFQGAALLDSLSVFDNVALPLQERTSHDQAEVRRRVLGTLEQLGLHGAENKYPAQLSGGMKKRVGLARALQLKPKIMLFDEPTTGLDPEKTMEIYQLFHQTQQQFGYTAVIVSHDIPKVFNLADQVIILNRGKAAVFASPQDIQRSEAPEIKEYVINTMGNIYLSREME
jgi:phospholipid/cholesterol/gamma-HCH transport system ATP-binding protein